VQFAVASLAVTLAFAGGLVVLGLIAFAAARGYPLSRAAAEAPGLPDWSVTVTAIEQPGIAVAITDRANRLVCANAAFELWFGSSHPPPRLPVDGASADALARAARNAWREG
jgi:two-component system cell cycle sensor histidine kinase/response regulator CckA